MGHSRKISRPPNRRLRVFVLDPSLKQSLETVIVNSVTFEIPWEDDPFQPGKDGPAVGPIGEYVEIIDYDPASGCFYEPLDLNNPYLLSQDGLSPSDGDPQFHQQMVYAVAMKTIKNFERALGRLVLWSSRRYKVNNEWRTEYVKQLRIYPHALREANAYYSPERKAILFGYFTATDNASGDHLPGGMVFTCLSHDIIVHELTHALLDGLHPRFNYPSNPDVLAFHEAFADIVALLQHFSFPEVVKHQIAKTRGNLNNSNLLADLAKEFGQAIGQSRALRSALGKPPDPTKLSGILEPHERGAVLMAAIFDAFLSIYRTRIQDLLRIATGGTGILQEGALHPDLVNRLVIEASKSADHVLTMCIRALDYLPPVDITFGDYLRALITADYDMVPNDILGYRVAFIEAFRNHGIYPENVRSLSEDSLLWQDTGGWLPVESLQDLVQGWDVTKDRKRLYSEMETARRKTHEIFKNSASFKQDQIGGVNIIDKVFEVHSIRPVRRVGPAGQLLVDLLIEITQSIPGYKQGNLKEANEKNNSDKGNFRFRGGCTLLIDMKTTKVRYCISKNINDEKRYLRQQDFYNKSMEQSYFYNYDRPIEDNLFSSLHKYSWKREVSNE